MKLYQVVLSDAQATGKAGSTRFAPLTEEDAAAVEETVVAEAAGWRLLVVNNSMHADDLHDTKSESTSHTNKSFEISEVKGFLVANGHFAGVVLSLEFWRGGGMSSYRDQYYCILHADGRISGKNEGGTSFTGEDSDSENIDTYILSSISGAVPVTEPECREGIFVFEISKERENTCTLIGIKGENLGALEIPDTLGGYTVRAIAPGICRGREDIEALTIPDSVEEIYEEAFAKCSRMRSLKIGRGLSAIGETGVYSGTGPFYACGALETIEVHPENKHFRSDGGCLIKIETDSWSGTHKDTVVLGCKSTDLTKAKEIVSIENYAFYGCEGIREIIVPPTVQSIGRSAFENCTSLKRAILFEGSREKTGISAYAFYGCTALEYVFIAKGLRWLEEDSFEDCTALKEICYGGTEENWRRAKTGYNYTPILEIPVLYGQTPKR